MHSWEKSPLFSKLWQLTSGLCLYWPLHYCLRLHLDILAWKKQPYKLMLSNQSLPLCVLWRILWWGCTHSVEQGINIWILSQPQSKTMPLNLESCPHPLFARRCPLYMTEPETPFDSHLCKAVTKTNQLTTKPPSRELIQSRISRGERTGADETSPWHFFTLFVINVFCFRDSVTLAVWWGTLFYVSTYSWFLQ